MNLVCKPSDYYVYSKSFASKYGVRTSILMSYLQDILTCEPINVKLDYNHIKTMTGLSKSDIKIAALELHKNNFFSIKIGEDIIVNPPSNQSNELIQESTSEECECKSDTLPFNIDKSYDAELKDLTEKYIGKKKKVDKDPDVAYEIIDYANSIWHTKFTCTNEYKKMIKKWLKEGYSKEDFFRVIRDRYNEWGVHPVMFKGTGSMSDEFLRPRTVFSSNFEEYVQKANKRELAECKKIYSNAVYKKASTDICDDLEF